MAGLKETERASALVGRGKELAAFAEHLRLARDGFGHALVVTGPAGIGKTSLLAAALAQKVDPDVTVLKTSGLLKTTHAAFSAVRGLFEPFGFTADVDSPLLAGSARLALPALMPSDWTSEVVEQSATGAYAVLHGLYWLAVTLTADGPLVLAVDDADLCDESSLRWLSFLLRRAENLPVLVVLARRGDVPGPADGVLGEVAAMRTSAVLPVGRLSVDAVGELIAARLPGRSDEAFVRGCAEETGGNPLLLVRRLGELRRGGVDGRPAAPADVVGSALDRLPAEARAVAVAVAVLGGEDLSVVAALSRLSEPEASTAVETLRANDVLLPRGLEFTHDLNRTEMLVGTSATELVELRARAAVLLNDAGRSVEDVAGQLVMLPRVTDSWMVTTLCEAAKSAENRGSPGVAARYLQRALIYDTKDAGVLVRLASALGQVEPLVTVRLLERALDLVDDPRARAPIAVALGMASLAVQASPEASGVLREVFDALEAELGAQPSAADAALLTLVESMLVITGLDEKATVGRTMAWVAERPAPEGNGPGERQLLAMHAAAVALAGDSAATAMEYGRRALRTDDVSLGGWAVLGASLALHLADDVEPAQNALSLLVDHSQSRGELWTYCLGLTTRALYRLQNGNLADAAADAQVSYDVVREELWGAGMVTPQIVLAHVLVQQRDPVRAEELLEGITRPRFDQFSLEYHWFLMARARAREALGDLEGALSYLLACGDSLLEAHIGNPVLAPWWLDGAHALATLGRRTEARDLAERGAEQAERWGTPSARGMGLLARGAVIEGDVGIDLLSEAADVLSRSVAPLEYAKAEYLLGTRLLERDDRKGARDRLRRSIDQSVLAGDRLQLAPATAALVKAGGRLRTGVSSATDMLTGSERRVAVMAADGATNRAIAEQLFVTVRTVETHLTSAYRKLDISGRAELAAALGPKRTRS